MWKMLSLRGVVILATLSHSQSESRISNTWSLSTNQKAGFNYPRKVASYQGIRHVRHHEKFPNIPPSCNSTPNVTFQLILFWRHSLFYKRDVCDLLLTSRPFRFKKFKKSSKKWPGKRWFGGHRRYWQEFLAFGRWVQPARWDSRLTGSNPVGNVFLCVCVLTECDAQNVDILLDL